MTDHILCKMTNLFFEDDRPLVTKQKIIFIIAVGMDKSPSIARLSNFACSQGVIEYYTKG